MPESLVSVVIPTYNAADFLGAALLSIRRQLWTALEIIVVDDGSTDGTLDLVARLGADIICISQANRGPAAARNCGLERARGEIIAFLDADDLWPDGTLARQVGRLAETGADVTLGRTALLSDACDGGDHSSRAPNPDRAQAESWFLPLLGSAAFRREVFQRVQRFDESLRYSEDHDWFLRARETDITISPIDATTLYYRVRPLSLTRAANCPNGYQLPRVLKRSLDRRRRAQTGPLCPFPGQARRMEGK